MAFGLPYMIEPSNERRWMLRAGQYDALSYLPKGWIATATLLREFHGENDAAAKAFLKCAEELADWLRRNGAPETTR